jgi:CBS-domain-containing membrane protein
MHVSEVMSRNVHWTTPSTTLADAARAMRARNIGCLPVQENGTFVGILTEKDFATRATTAGLDPNASTVSEIMTTQVVYCQDDDSIEVAMDIMRRRQIHHLPVYDQSSGVVGIVSLADFALKAPQELYPSIANLAFQRASMKRRTSSIPVRVSKWLPSC